MDYEGEFRNIIEIIKRDIAQDGGMLLADFTAEFWRGIVLGFLNDSGTPKDDFSGMEYIQEKTIGDVLWNLETYLRVQPCALGAGGCLFMTISPNAVKNILQVSDTILDMMDDSMLTPESRMTTADLRAAGQWA